jgi:lysozyme
MTSPYLIEDLKRDEGEPGTAAPALTAYPDALSPLGRACEAMRLSLRDYRRVPGWERLSGDPWTIGWGATGKDIKEGVTWTLNQAEARLLSGVLATIAGLNGSVSWWRGLSPLRQDVFVNMAFNLGLPRFLKFKKFLAAASRRDWTTAKAEMLDSLWDHELKARAERLAEQLLTDTHPDPFHPSAPSPGQPAAA